MNKSVAKEDVKKLLLTISELNGAISNFITNSGGSMSEPKVEETVATAPAPVESAEATKVVEQAGTETVPAAAASPLPAAEETKAA